MGRPATGRAIAGPLAALARVRRPPVAAGDRCEMCAEPLDPEHRHVVDLHDRSLRCTCRACGLLFTSGGAAGGRYRSVPDRYARVEGFALSAADWDALQIPVSLAFFFHNSTTGATSAFFPGPAGATECQLPLGLWDAIESANPVVTTLELDTEALLVRVSRDDHEEPTAEPTDGGPARATCFIVPIDACYELVGRLRSSWRGFDGGREGHGAIEDFFTDLAARARPVPRGAT